MTETKQVTTNIQTLPRVVLEVAIEVSRQRGCSIDQAFFALMEAATKEVA